MKKAFRRLFIAYTPYCIILSAMFVIPFVGDFSIGISLAIGVPLFLLLFGFFMFRSIRYYKSHPKSFPLNLKYRWSVFLLTATLWFFIFLSKNKTVVAVAAFLAVCLLAFTWYQLRKNKGLSDPAKNGSLYCILLLCIMLFIAFIKLVPGIPDAP